MMKYRNWRKKLTAAVLTVTMLVTPAFAAGGIADSKIGKGFERLIDDLTIWVGGIGCGVSILAAMVFWAARSMADEQDAKAWNKRIKWAFICAAAIPLVSALVNLLSSYFI